MNVAPWPGSLSHQTLPFMASTIFLTMDKPKPVECSPPVGLALSLANLPNSFYCLKLATQCRARDRVYGPTQRVLYLFIQPSLGKAGRGCCP